MRSQRSTQSPRPTDPLLPGASRSRKLVHVRTMRRTDFLDLGKRLLTRVRNGDFMEDFCPENVRYIGRATARKTGLGPSSVWEISLDSPARSPTSSPTNRETSLRAPYSKPPGRNESFASRAGRLSPFGNVYIPRPIRRDLRRSELGFGMGD